MPYRLIVADLDGTLMGDDLTISPGVLAAVREAQRQGFYFTVATGRTFEGALPFLQELDVNAPIILYQGGEIRDMESGEVLYRATLPMDDAREFISFVAARGLQLNMYLDDQVYVAHETPELEWYTNMNRVKVHAVGDLQAFMQREPHKFLIVAPSERLDEVAPILQEHFAGRLQIVRSYRYFLEAIPLEVDKGKGVARLARRLGVAQKDVVAIGDNDNDAAMVEWAGLGVAMGNASPAVRQVADIVAPSVEDDGVAWTITTQVLESSSDTDADSHLLSWCSVPEAREDILYTADDPAYIARASELLRSGRLVAFPTDTVYGIGADARLTDAVYEIYIAKRRSPDKAIPLLISDLKEIQPFVAYIPSGARALIDAFWPGSLTIVLPIAAGVPAIISPGPGIAVRMPNHPVALELIRQLGSPIAATSANISGKPDATTALAVVEQLGRRIDMVLDGGSTPGARPSTIVDFTQQPARVLRLGPISLEQLRLLVPELADSSGSK